MQGFPRRLNTRHDYEYVRANFPDGQWKPAWRELLRSRHIWRNVRELRGGEAGATDASHRVVEFRAGPDGPAARMQQELAENPGAALFRLGFTVAEVAAALGEGDAAPPEPAAAVETYLLNKSRTYHRSGCRYASEGGRALTLSAIAAGTPGARPCSRCGAPALLPAEGAGG